MARGNVSIMRSPGRCASRRDGKNHVFKSYDDLVDHCCTAWNRLIDQPWRIMSIGLRDWLRNDAARPGYGNDLAEFRLGFQKPRYYPVSPKGSRFPAVGEAMTSRTVMGLRDGGQPLALHRSVATPARSNDELNRENLRSSQVRRRQGLMRAMAWRWTSLSFDRRLAVQETVRAPQRPNQCD